MTTKLMKNLLFHLKVGDFRLPPRGVGKLTILDQILIEGYYIAIYKRTDYGVEVVVVVDKTGGQDVFVHYSGLHDGSSLKQSDRVSFELGQDGDR